jgi:hypothetical protein
MIASGGICCCSMIAFFFSSSFDLISKTAGISWMLAHRYWYFCTNPAPLYLPVYAGVVPG